MRADIVAKDAQIRNDLELALANVGLELPIFTEPETPRLSGRSGFVVDSAADKDRQQTASANMARALIKPARNLLKHVRKVRFQMVRRHKDRQRRSVIGTGGDIGGGRVCHSQSFSGPFDGGGCDPTCGGHHRAVGQRDAGSVVVIWIEAFQEPGDFLLIVRGAGKQAGPAAEDALRGPL